MQNRVAVVRQRMIGGVFVLGALALLIATGAPSVGSNPTLGVLARVFDSLSPLLITFSALAGLILLALRARWVGRVTLAGSLLAAIWLVGQHLGVSAPLRPDLRADLRVIWFNSLFENTTDPARIVDAVLAENPDIVVFSEALPLVPQLDRLRAAFPWNVGCETRCELLMLSRRQPDRMEIATLSDMRPDRRAELWLTLPGGRPFHLMAVHMSKPWYQDPAVHEHENFFSRLSRIHDPLLVMGDFNAAPWSWSMRQVFKQGRLAPPRLPVGTWPIGLGGWGLPIDHMLVRDGARLVSLRPFGADLGSNHRGLLAEIAVP